MKIKHIDIVHHSHVDYGYTDHPEVTRMLQKRYVDMALDAVVATKDNSRDEKFYWTAEILEPVWEWWKYAADSRRELFLKAVEAGQIEVCGFVYNNTAFLNTAQWDKLFNWIPEELWKKLKIRSGMQTDVNGMPLAGITRAYNKGMRYFWTGPNSYLGSVPFKQPSAFRWKMPKGGEVFVWLNSGYSNAHYLFNDNWRQGPVPHAADLHYRKPERGDIFASDSESILKAHEMCIQNLKLLEALPGEITVEKVGRQLENTQFSAKGGYEYPRLLVSLTNQWRIDNDPPFLPITEFVSKWNSMGLEPQLRLTTPTIAMSDLEKEIGRTILEYSGEWVDWWAKGSLSAPVDMAAARKAKRILKLIESPVFKEIKIGDESSVDKAMRELCMFDEHTWGSWGSVAYPYNNAALGERYEKSCLAYRPLAVSELLLADRVRAKFKEGEKGIYVTNPSKFTISDWIELPSDCLRGDYTHIKDAETGEVQEIVYTRGSENFIEPVSEVDFTFKNVSRTFKDNVEGKKAKFWCGNIKPLKTKRFLTVTNKIRNVGCSDATDKIAFEMKHDNAGWPVSLQWNGMSSAMFEEGLGDFVSLKPKGISPRWVIKDMFDTDDDEERLEKRKQNVIELSASYENSVSIEDTQYTLIFKQVFSHPSLLWGERELQVWKNEPRVRLKLKINRQYNIQPEVFFVRFPFSCKGLIPFTSNGGNVFKPGEGQLPGSCMDYYAIDGWVHYGSDEGNWIWSAKDSPMVTFGEPKMGDKIEKNPENMEILYAKVFDNTWDTNFPGDSHGDMEFTFDLVWKPVEFEFNADTLAESISSEPIVLVKT